MKVTKSMALREGDLFNLALGEFKEGNSENRVINIHDVEGQKIFGFGGAITDSAAYNYYIMPESEKKKSLEYLFGESGLKYNYLRICIGSCDFSVDEYSYVADGDETLKSFSIDRDRKYVIPFIKDIIAYSKQNLTFFASPWSPPAFMKDNGSLIKGGKLKREYYPLYAEYIAKFIEEYDAEGIKISAVTMQNEPNAAQTWESCVFSADDEAVYSKFLYEAFKKHNLDVKIICWDHCRERLFERADEVYKKADEYVWGAGYHWYSGTYFEEISLLRKVYPDKAIIETEFCGGIGRREYFKYHFDIMKSLEMGTNAIVEWNVILDEEGGPYHNRSFGCNVPVMYDRYAKAVVKRSIFNSTYLFSHFIEQGAVTLATSSFSLEFDSLAVKNPDGKIYLYIGNRSDAETDVNVRYGGLEYVVQIPARGVVMLQIEE